MDLESVSIPPTVWSDRTLLSGLCTCPPIASGRCHTGGRATSGIALASTPSAPMLIVTSLPSGSSDGDALWCAALHALGEPVPPDLGTKPAAQIEKNAEQPQE